MNISLNHPLPWRVFLGAASFDHYPLSGIVLSHLHPKIISLHRTRTQKVDRSRRLRFGGPLSYRILERWSRWSFANGLPARVKLISHIFHDTRPTKSDLVTVLCAIRQSNGTEKRRSLSLFDDHAVSADVWEFRAKAPLLAVSSVKGDVFCVYVSKKGHDHMYI